MNRSSCFQRFLSPPSHLHIVLDAMHDSVTFAVLEHRGVGGDDAKETPNTAAMLIVGLNEKKKVRATDVGLMQLTELKLQHF